jgi:hypothetical protein
VRPGRGPRPGRREPRRREPRRREQALLEPGGLSRRRAWLVVAVIGWTFTVATGLGFYSLPLYLNILVANRGFALTA